MLDLKAATRGVSSVFPLLGDPELEFDSVGTKFLVAEYDNSALAYCSMCKSLSDPVSAEVDGILGNLT